MSYICYVTCTKSNKGRRGSERGKKKGKGGRWKGGRRAEWMEEGTKGVRGRNEGGMEGRKEGRR